MIGWYIFDIGQILIQSPAKCEVRPVISFLKAKGERLADVYKQVVAVYGEVMNRQNVCRCAGDQWLSTAHWDIVLPGGRKRPWRDADPSPLLVPRSKTE
jgi:hypothetical protein